MKSTLLNMTAVLFGITLVASAGVGFVNMITVEPIAAAKEAATLAALNEVLPAFDATTTEELTICLLYTSRSTNRRTMPPGKPPGIPRRSLPSNATSAGPAARRRRPKPKSCSRFTNNPYFEHCLFGIPHYRSERK